MANKIDGGGSMMKCPLCGLEFNYDDLQRQIHHMKSDHPGYRVGGSAEYLLPPEEIEEAQVAVVSQ